MLSIVSFLFFFFFLLFVCRIISWCIWFQLVWVMEAMAQECSPNHGQCFITNNIIVSLTYCVPSKDLNSVPLGSHWFQFTSVQSLRHVWLFATPWTAACQASLSITNSRSLPKLMSIQSAMPSNPLILCCLLLILPSNFPSIRIFSSESALCIMWPKYWFQLPHHSFQWTPKTDLL